MTHMTLPVLLEPTMREGKPVITVGGNTYTVLRQVKNPDVCLLMGFDPARFLAEGFFAWEIGTNNMVPVTHKKHFALAVQELTGKADYDSIGCVSSVLRLEQVAILAAVAICRANASEDQWRDIITEQMELCWSAGVLAVQTLQEEVPVLCKEFKVDYDHWMAIGRLTSTYTYTPVTITPEQHANPRFWDKHIRPVSGKEIYMPICVELLLAAMPLALDDIKEELELK